jgi:hypothetical protein
MASSRGPTPERKGGSTIGANMARSCMSCLIFCSSASRFFLSISVA